MDVRKVKQGTRITVPETPEQLAELADQIKHLLDLVEDENEVVNLSYDIDALVLEGAYVLQLALAEIGTVIQKPDKYGDRDSFSFTISRGQTISVPFGIFQVSGIQGEIHTAYNRNSKGRYIFRLVGVVAKKETSKIEELVARVKDILKVKSIFKGKAYRLAFRDPHHGPNTMPSPEFLDLESAYLPIFNPQTELEVERRILAPIRMYKEWAALGLTFKRGVLLSGTYGVGKTLLASYIGKVAEQHGVTFHYARTANELADALSFVEAHTPAIVFIEDIDSTMGDEERNEDMNQVLNLLDGVGTKDLDIMTILTTNDIDSLTPALLRHERMDVILEIDLPNAQTVERLLNFYAGNHLLSGVSLTQMASQLSGQSPATIRGALRIATEISALRSRGSQIAIQQSDLDEATDSVLRQIELSRRVAQAQEDERRSFASTLARILGQNGDRE